MLTFKSVVEQEKAQLRLRREKLGHEDADPKTENWFGIALSGGGIRSATVNLGILKTLNKFGIIDRADYLSTVSGGGYTHAYLQGTVKSEGDFKKLFTNAQIDAMRKHGEYMTPGKGIVKSFNTFTLIVAFVVSWLMSLVSPMIVIGIAYHLYVIATSMLGHAPLMDLQIFTGHDLGWWVTVIAGSIIGLHYLVNIFLNFNLGISKLFNRLEVFLLIGAALLYAWVLLTGLQGGEKLGSDELIVYIRNTFLLFFLGYFANPNALSFHRYYRKQLADLFLRFAGPHANVPMMDLFNTLSDKKADYAAPYPLINTCLNLLNPDGDPVFKGSKTSDYFLISPMYCGSKLVGYVPTDRYADYQRMTLPAAVTVSAAAVNPGMGMYSNKILSILMTLLNARLGFWISNPLKLERKQPIVWWPLYFFRELLGKIGSNNTMINISDGGHIENLGVYELLRRECRLIIGVDAGEDQTYGFADLNNLIIRARNELGLEIRFRPDEQPEELIRPRPSQVYSQKRYAIADIYKWWEDEKTTDPETGREITRVINFPAPKKVGTYIYVKSSVKAPTGKPSLSPSDRLKYGTYKYKIYHPDFPHESTSDQFFDEIQWEAYYQLGQFMGAEILGIGDPDEYNDIEKNPKPSIDQWVKWFDKGVSPFQKTESLPTPEEPAFESTKKEVKPPAAAPKYEI